MRLVSHNFKEGGKSELLSSHVLTILPTEKVVSGNERGNGMVRFESGHESDSAFGNDKHRFD